MMLTHKYPQAQFPAHLRSDSKSEQQQQPDADSESDEFRPV